MRRTLPALTLVIFAAIAASTSAAEKVLGPADYLTLMTESKLRYNLIGEPSKTPLAPMDCPRRDEVSRVEVKGPNDKTLVESKEKPEATKLIDEGEALYVAEKRDEAVAKYRAAIAADPNVPRAYFYLGDALLFGTAADPAAALEQYRKGVALDPTIPSGHFYSATALVRLGRNDEAREEIIKALTYFPSYPTLWKVADQAADRWNARITRHKFEPPAGYIGGDSKKGIDIYFGKDGEWIGYATCKAVWANEKQFAARHGNGGWSLDEERACVLNQLMTLYNASENKLTDEQKKKNGVANPKITESQIIAAMPPLGRHLFEVAQAQLLDGYVLFEIIGQHCPVAMSIMADDALKQVDAYIRRYVVVAK